VRFSPEKIQNTISRGFTVLETDIFPGDVLRRVIPLAKRAFGCINVQNAPEYRAGS
jgi:hypothetical protein